MTTARENLREAERTLQRAVERGDVSKADADRIEELCAAFDPDDMTTPLPSDGEYAEDTKPKQPNTLWGRMQYLKRTAERLNGGGYETTLSTADADTINQLIEIASAYLRLQAEVERTVAPFVGGFKPVAL